MSICPVTSHIVASQLKKEYGVFWLADFPDLWSQNFNYSYGAIRRFIDRSLEKKTMGNVDIIVSSSQSCADRLGVLHVGKPAHSVTLGYDPQEYDIEPAVPGDKFTITYTGLVYPKKQSPIKLLTALSELLAESKLDHKDCDIRFYGCNYSWLKADIDALDLSDIVSQHSTIPHSDIVDIQRKSQVLLLLDWDDPNELGAYTAKLFEYLGARRPILVVGGVHGNSVSKLLGKTHAGVHAPLVSNVKEAVVAYYGEYKQNNRVSYSGINSEILKHSQRVMTGKFADLLSDGVG